MYKFKAKSAAPDSPGSGTLEVSSFGGVDPETDIENPAPAQAEILPKPVRYIRAPRYELAHRRNVERAWRLGPAPMACLLEDIAAGADLRETVARFAAIDPTVVAAFGGDQFPPPMLRVLDGERR